MSKKQVFCRDCGREIHPASREGSPAHAGEFFDWQRGRWFATAAGAAGKCICRDCFNKRVNSLCEAIHDDPRNFTLGMAQFGASTTLDAIRWQDEVDNDD